MSIYYYVELKNFNKRGISKMTEHYKKDFPYIANVNADPRIVGFPAILNPFTQQDSAPRADMFRSHMSQAVSLNNPEFPKIFSGYEYDTMAFCHTGTEREHDARILAVIPKYRGQKKDGTYMKSPSKTVIYEDLETGELNYFELAEYGMGDSGFGWKLIHENSHLLEPDTYLPKETIIARTPSQQGNKYCIGINANTAFMSHPDTVEDAMLISQSFADKMKSEEVKKITISVHPGEHPINQYGSIDSEEDIFKFLPDIGECVGNNGILCSFRRPSVDTFTADMSKESMHKIQPLHDRMIKIPPGSKIIDMDFYPTNQRDRIPWSVFGQAEDYVNSKLVYWERIISIIEDLSKYNKPLSPMFNTFLTRAYLHYGALGGKVAGVPTRRCKFINKGEKQIDFLEIEITYVVTRTVERGFKITDQHGAKGVISRICPDEDMPIDEYGVRADLVSGPNSIMARMNIGQLSEHAINHISEFVLRKIKNISHDTDAAFDMLLDYYNDINPKYAQLVKSISTPEKKKDHIKEVIANGIYLNVPPFLDTFRDVHNLHRAIIKLKTTNPDEAKVMMKRSGIKEKDLKNVKENIFIMLKKKWGSKETPVTYGVSGDQGPDRKFTTKEPVCIGSKYMLLLSNIPKPSSPGVAKVSHHGVPMKTPIGLRDATSISDNPTRFGEDEERIILTEGNSEENARLMSLQSASITAIEKISETLLMSDHPTQIDRMDMTNKELSASNMVHGLLHHCLATQGIELNKKE